MMIGTGVVVMGWYGGVGDGLAHVEWVMIGWVVILGWHVPTHHGRYLGCDVRAAARTSCV